MALIQQTKYSLGVRWGTGDDAKNRTLSGFNATTTELNDDMSWVGGFGQAFCSRLSLFSNTGVNVISVSKEMPWQNDG